MARRFQFTALFTALLMTAALPALAASSASSASSEGSSASSGSVSDSFEGSSNSSSGQKKVAEGEYRIVHVAAATQPGKMRLVLQGIGDVQGEFVLLVPEATVQQAALAEGSTVQARARAYGWEFAAGTPRQAFYLAVNDEQRREFATRKVSL